MSMDITKFTTVTHVRKPFEVEAVEVTSDNIEELSEFIGELKVKDGTPYIQSEKKLVGNTFKVWPGFFVTVLNGKVRCYSRRIFFEQFAEKSSVQEGVDILNGKRKPKPRTTPEAVKESFDKGEIVRLPVGDDEYVYTDADAAPAVEVVVPEETAATCEHGTPEGSECVYKKCKGAETDEPADEDEVDLDQPLGEYGRPIVDEPLVELPQPEPDDEFEQVEADVAEAVSPVLNKRFDEPVGKTLSEVIAEREAGAQTA